MSWEAFAQIVGSLASAKQAFDPESTGGGGGATSASVQPGQTGIQYQDVIGTGITPFEYQEVLAQLEDEDQRRQMAEALAQAQGQGLWSGGLISLMQGGPLYANEGMEIEDYFSEIEFDPNAIGSEVISYDETGQPRTEETFLTDPLTGEEFGQQTADINKGIRADRRQDIIEAITKGIGAIAKAKQAFDPETTQFPSSRTSVVPLPGGGIGKRQAPYPEPKGSGITPFTYQGVAGGGALGRSMFAKNYMPHGGAMQGPGGPKSDLIPVMASDGEYMLSKAAVDQAGGGNHTKGIARLEQFNRLGNRRYG